jgi:hypothetical protein
MNVTFGTEFASRSARLQRLAAFWDRFLGLQLPAAQAKIRPALRASPLLHRKSDSKIRQAPRLESRQRFAPFPMFNSETGSNDPKSRINGFVH